MARLIGARVSLTRPVGLRPAGTVGHVVRAYKGAGFAARVMFDGGGQADVYADEFQGAA